MSRLVRRASPSQPLDGCVIDIYFGEVVMVHPKG